MSLKIDIINGAYSILRISGLTIQPTPEDTRLGLEKLEDMAAEFAGRNICVNYNFEDQPDVNSVHNMDRKYWSSFKYLLASRMIDDFGKPTPQSLARQSAAAFNFLSTETAVVVPTQYPSRQPRGSGSTLRYNRYQRFYSPTEQAPVECETQVLFEGDINDYTESYSSFLDAGELIDSFTITVTSGLTIQSSLLTGNDIDYRIKANETDTEIQNVQIVVTTSIGRKTTRVIYFVIKDAPE